MIKTVQVLVGVSDNAQKSATKIIKILKRSFEVVEENPDLYIVVGGDGTLLHWLGELNYPTIPFLGIDAGTLGYFQEILPDDLPELLRRIKSGRCQEQKFPLLGLRSDGKLKGHAFNEFAIERASARAVNLSLQLDGFKFEKFIGDGLIISSPQGSTAYAGAAGGAILPYDLDVFEVVPSNPHQSAIYKALRQPLVLSNKARIHIDVLDSTHRPVRVVADGHEVEVNGSFDIGISGKYIKMLRTHEFNFYERLNSKLIG